MPLLRVVVRREAVDAGIGLRADDVVHRPADAAQRLDVVVPGQLVDVAGPVEPVAHPALEHPHPRRVGDGGLLVADLGAVGKAGDHLRLLAPLLGEAALRGRRAIGILQALDVPQHQGSEPDADDVPVEVHLHAGLVAVARRVDDAVPVGVLLEDRPQRALELGVHADHVLPLLEGAHRHPGAVLDGAGHLDQAVDALRVGEQIGIGGDAGPPCGDGVLEVGEPLHAHRRRARLHEGALRVPDRAVGDRHEAHSRDGVDDLVGDAAGHEPRADHSHTDRAALRLPPAERGVDDDHEACAAPKSGQAASLSEITSTGTGQTMPSAGSSYRMPRSASGA